MTIVSTKTAKKYFNFFNILGIVAFLLVFSKLNFDSISSVNTIFLVSIVPALFPFILFSNILTLSNYTEYLTESFVCTILSKVFKISKSGSSAILLGFLLGYPNSAKYVNELYENNKISLKEANFLMRIVNNGSPAYLLSSIGIGIFGNIYVGIILLLSHFLASIVVGIIYSFENKEEYLQIRKREKSKEKNNVYKEDIRTNLNFDVIISSIKKTFVTLGIIYAFMVIANLVFNNITLMLKTHNEYVNYSVLGIFDITSGIASLKQVATNPSTLLLTSSFLLGFSSLSIILQVYSCMYKTGIPLSKVIVNKLTQGIVSTVITYILILVGVFQDKLASSQTVFASNNEFIQNILNSPSMSVYVMFVCFVISFIIVTILSLIFSFIVSVRNFRKGGL